MTTDRLRTLAVHGARIRLAQLAEEQRAIRQLFPDLQPAPMEVSARPPRRTMSPARRAQVSRTMKAYWANWRRQRRATERG